MKISSIAVGALCAASFFTPARAGDTLYGVGTQALPLQQAGGTARAMAMGSAVVAVSQGSASLLWNPAGLGRLDAPEFGLHHNSGLGDTMQEIFIFGMPLGQPPEEGKGGALGGLAASLGYVNYGLVDATDGTGLDAGQSSYGDLSGSVGWGKEILSGLSGGVALRGNRSEFGSRIYYTFSTDVGLLWKVLPALDLGVSYSNFKMAGKIGDQASGLRVGAGWTIDKRWLLGASSELQDKAMKRLQLGTEYLIGDVSQIANVLAVRLGYQISYPSRELGALAGLTWGLGYAVTRSMAVDYALLPSGDLGVSHRLSLTYKFNSPGKTAAQ